MKKLIHQWSWVLLVLFLGGGFFYPLLGIMAVVCMLAPSIVAIFRGRLWCGYFCPRGSFNDSILAKLTRKHKLPAFIKSSKFKAGFLIFLMGTFAFQIWSVWGNFAAIGLIFWRMVFLTTLVTIFLGIFYTPRVWCMICPMGTLASYVAKWRQNYLQHVSFKNNLCNNCKSCSRSCPMQIEVNSYREQLVVKDESCLKCNHCVTKCPKKFLQSVD